jgi:hypothetical protein
MITKLTVFKEVYNSWDANEKRKAGEAWDLLCLDISEPAEHRMEEMLYYRLKPEERQAYWGKTVGKTIEVGIAKIRHGDNGGKATLLGQIITAK